MMSRLFALSFLLLASLAAGFLQPTSNRRISHKSNGITKSHCLETSSRLLMANITVPSIDDEDVQTKSRKGFQKTFDSFTTTGSYRTFLFCGAFLSSQKCRDFIGIPGCIGVVAITFAVYTYDIRFNYLVDAVTPKRQAALCQLRAAKAAQLTSRPTNDGPTLEELTAAYEEVLREELSTRVLIPGLWVIEMDPEQEDRSAAPQLMGLEITDQHTLEPVKRR
jgi:hypothetical protein